MTAELVKNNSLSDELVNLLGIERITKKSITSKKR